jgi:hypothetical protein
MSVPTYSLLAGEYYYKSCQCRRTQYLLDGTIINHVSANVFTTSCEYVAADMIYYSTIQLVVSADMIYYSTIQLGLSTWMVL